MLSRNEFEKILKERNVKALKRCIQNNEITDEMYKTMFVSYCSSAPDIRYMFDFFQYHYNDVDKNAVEITDILLKNVPICYLSSGSYFCHHNIYQRNIERIVNAGLLMFVSYPFVQFILLHYPKILAERLFETISKSGRSDVIVGEKFIKEVRKYHERRGSSYNIGSTEKVIKKHCIEIENGDYILAPYQFKNVVSERTIEELKDLPIELTKDFIMLNPVRVNAFKEIEPILESIKYKVTNANIGAITKVNYMLSHIVREYW